MSRYIVRRLIQGVFTLWVIVSLVFLLLFLLFFLGKNDPAQALAGKAATVQQVQTIRVALGLNKPVWQQYLLYLDRLIHGNLGTSYKLHEQVTSLLGQWVPIDIALAGGGGILWLALRPRIRILAPPRPRGVRD